MGQSSEFSKGPVGDLHNFGKRVSFFESTTGLVVFKPRTVFWEHMFLDPKSEFRDALRLLTEYRSDQYLGSVSVQNNPCFSEGTANVVNLDRSSSTSFNEVSLRNFGRLIAFSSIYGLTDLHIENLLLTDVGVQLLDIESVFSMVESPLDSLLVPGKAFNRSRSIFSKIAALPISVVVENLIGAMNEEFANLRAIRNVLLSFHRKQIDTYRTIQIRFLIRPSKDYAQPAGSHLIPFLESEKVQMNRGDIPYFFGFVDKGDVWTYTSPTSFEPIKDSFHPYLKTKLERSFKRPDQLLDSDRLLRLHKQSVMITLSKLFDENSSFAHRDDSFECSAQNGLLQFSCDEFKIAAKLPKAAERIEQT